jgi:hypothetical protein
MALYISSKLVDCVAAGPTTQPYRHRPPSATAWGMASFSMPTTTQQVISPTPLSQSLSLPTLCVLSLCCRFEYEWRVGMAHGWETWVDNCSTTVIHFSRTSIVDESFLYPHWCLMIPQYESIRVFRCASTLFSIARLSARLCNIHKVSINYGLIHIHCLLKRHRLLFFGRLSGALSLLV